MRKYKIIVEGKNCFIMLDNVVQRHGFFATRFIEAEDAKSALNIAIDLVRTELRSVLLNDQSNLPPMYIDEIHEVQSFGDNQIPGKGVTWYPDPEE